MPPLRRDSAPDLTPETLRQAAAGSERDPPGSPDLPGSSETARLEGAATLHSAPHAAPHAAPHSTLHAAPPTTPPTTSAERSVRQVVPLEQPSEPFTDVAPHTTQGGTQISTFDPDERRALFGGMPSRRPTSSDRTRTVADAAQPRSRELEQQFRRIEHRLDQLDARMRLLEKSAERSGAESRAGLLWWGVVLLAAILWGVFQRS